MAVSQNTIRNRVESTEAAVKHLTAAEPRRSDREVIERMLADRSPETASRLAAYWRRHRSPAAAHFVVAGFERLLPQLQLTHCRLSILRSFTVEPLLPLLKAAAFSAGIHLDVRLSDFNTYVQQILDPASKLYAERPDVVILAVETADVAPQVWRGGDMSRDQLAAVVSDVTARFESWIDAFRSRSNATLIVHNLQVPPVSSRGLLDTQSLQGPFDAIIDINRSLRRTAANYAGVYVLDYDALVARQGRSRWSDEAKRLTISLPIAPANLIYVAEEWMRFLHPITGRVAKALVVDLDNTLWGGILGEDGRAGIHLGTEYPGIVYREVQRALLELRDRGILLAIASKNDLHEAIDILATHPDMLLRPDHFAAARIGWQEKSQSIREIAAELNIGLDSLAFLDDNPVERERISTELPEVTVIDLPAEPIRFAQAVRDCPVFERLTISEEDRQRGQYYSDQRQREQLQRASRTPEEFFRSLQQVVEIRRAEHSTIPRIAQLTQKTNQFNLTTRRYTEQEIADLAAREDTDVFSMRVTDVYNDNGIVGAAIVQHNGTASEIDTFLLSCRVIGRTVETALLARLSEEARRRGATTVLGRFCPTKKNVPAADFFIRHGFVPLEQNGQGSSYHFDLTRGEIVTPDWITVL